MILYHYRKIDSALAEIRNHSIRFSSKENLNDPMEGFVNLVWQGDKPAWEGLFRNYFCSFNNALVELGRTKSELDIDSEIIICDVDSVDPGIRDASEIFLADEDVQMIAEALSHYKVDCDMEELQAILSVLTEKIVNSLVSAGDYWGMKLGGFMLQSGLNVHQVAEGIRSCASSGKIKDLLKSYYALAYGSDVKRFKQVYQNISESDESKKSFRNYIRLRFDFNQTYVEQLYKTIFPRGYVTCFSESPYETVMWGNYAESHNGVCLKYEIDEHETRADFPEKNSNMFNDIYAVRYVRGPQYIIQRNFFNDIWFNYPSGIAKTWLTGLNDAESEIVYDVEAEKQYNGLFEKVYTQKMPDWKYEKEHRILLKSKDVDLNKKYVDIPFDRKCLEGVIFGIKTPLDVMAEIESAIEEGGYQNVEFERAYFDTASQTIKTVHVVRDEYDFEKYKFHMVSEIVNKE